MCAVIIIFTLFCYASEGETTRYNGDCSLLNASQRRSMSSTTLAEGGERCDPGALIITFLQDLMGICICMIKGLAVRAYLPSSGDLYFSKVQFSTYWLSPY